MGRATFSIDDYHRARRDYGVEGSSDVTRSAEQRANRTGHLDPKVDPAVEPMRRSMLRLDPHQRQWIATVGCPMDIEVSCDTTGSMGGEVDTEMNVLPELYEAVSKVLPGYDPQLCLGIFGDLQDRFALCRPQFEMEAPKIVDYLRRMAPQRAGGDSPEDPQYAMFARAYLTSAYTNRIGLKGYHFIVTDATCHRHVSSSAIRSIFGENIFEEELKGFDPNEFALNKVIANLKRRTHQFILLVTPDPYTRMAWERLCGASSVISIGSTKQLPAVISAVIGLTEGTLDLGELGRHLGNHANMRLVEELSRIDIGAQAKLRRQLPHPVPKAGDVFARKSDLWPIQPGETPDELESPEDEPDRITYL